jgi:hypothetical protein
MILILEEYTFCNCCSQYAKKSKHDVLYPICVDNKKLSVCGSGNFLYFYFIQFTIVVLLIASCMICIPQIITSVRINKEMQDICNKTNFANYTHCESYKTTNDFLVSMSFQNMREFNLLYKHLYNSTEDYVIDYTFINGLVMFVLFFLNMGAVIDVYNDVIEMDYTMVTPSDYTLMISNINAIFTDEKDLIDNYLTLTRNIEIKSVENKVNDFNLAC